ncbi:WD40 repeat-like protein [Clavulina sp. PMI_390]|nr:WD40 repeat-like protein [Clavulina sp. PMI_390]
MEVWPSLWQHWQAKSAVEVVAFAPKRGLVAAGLENGEIQLWSVETGQQEGLSLTGHDDSVESVAFSPDGALLASGSWDNTIRLWDVQSQTAIGVPLTGHDKEVTSVAFSPYEALLASGSWDNTIRLWDVQSQTAIGVPLTGHNDCVTSVAFSPDGALLASGSGDKTIRLLWDVQSQIAIGVPLTGHDRSVRSVAFSPDGALLASCSNETIQLSSTTQNLFAAYINVPHHNHHFNMSMSPSSWHKTLQNGWLKGPHNELVLWIPATYTAAPYHEQLVAILGRGITQVPHLKVDKMVLGTEWVKCYTPLLV